MTEHPPVDVAIVGYGPVGACAALLLADAGLRVVVLERDRELCDLPRAVGLDGESVRGLQRIGLGERVAGVLQPPRPGEEVCFTDSRRRKLFGLPLPVRGHNGWRDIAFFDQPELEALLRECVAACPEVEVRLGCEVVGLEPEADVVRLRTRDAAEASPAREEDVTAAWVLGCDGASSTVRRAAGIGWRSLGYDQDWLVIDIVLGPGAELPIDTMQVCDPERLTTYVCVKDPYRRWEFQLLPGETREAMLRPERVEALLRPWIAPEHYTLRREAVYQFHAATAERWRAGRVLLAGDAAHQTPPFLGQGLNAGFRDAVNLGWKLPLVVRGACDERLLDSYPAERDAHARDLVDWAVSVGKLMENLAAREAGRPPPHPDIDPSSGYGQGRTAPPLRDGVLALDQVRAGRPVGVLLRQPRVRRRDRPGEPPVPLDDLLGPGFAVVGRKPGDLRPGPAARAVLERLGGRFVPLDTLEPDDLGHDALLDAHAAAVVRPDRHVFGVVDESHDLDALLLELGDRLALR